jgi:hypothetical protein
MRYLLHSGAMVGGKSCNRAVPHGVGLEIEFRDFPGFIACTSERESYSRALENGINKKHLPRLISIVNLGKLFRVFTQ